MNNDGEEHDSWSNGNGSDFNSALAVCPPDNSLPAASQLQQQQEKPLEDDADKMETFSFRQNMLDLRDRLSMPTRQSDHQWSAGSTTSSMNGNRPWFPLHDETPKEHHAGWLTPATVGARDSDDLKSKKSRRCLWILLVVFVIVLIASAASVGAATATSRQSKAAATTSDDRSNGQPTTGSGPSSGSPQSSANPAVGNETFTASPASPIAVLPPSAAPTETMKTVNPTYFPSGAATYAPTSLNTPTYNPTYSEPCPALLNAYSECLDTQLTSTEAESCINCTNMALDSSSTVSCDAFSSDYCAAFLQCYDCGDCLAAMDDYVACSVVPQCTLNCVPASSPTLAPTLNETCPSLANAYEQCLAANVSETQAEACKDCANNALDNASRDSCNAFTAGFCANFTYCRDDCGVCADKIVDYIDCTSGGQWCTTQCPTNSTTSGGTPSSSSCSVAEAKYETCLSNDLFSVQQDSCRSCVNAALGNSSYASCTAFTGDFCPAFVSCSEECTGCMTEIQEWVDCTVGGYQCAIDCGVDSNYLCASEENAYVSCFGSELTALEAASCISCANLAQGSASLNSCEEFESNFCPSFSQCSCGSCKDEVVAYVDCVVTDGDTCGISCDIGSSNSTAACDANKTAYQVCLAMQLSSSQASSCLGCVEDAIRFASFDNCSTFEETFCVDFTLCRCGSCIDELQGYVDCLNGDSCGLNCAATDQSTSLASTQICADYSGLEQDGYQICLDLKVLGEDESVFQSASLAWSGKVVGDLPAVSTADLDPRFACSSFPDVIDDLYICGQYEMIDGVGGVLGQSTPTYTRFSTNLPVTGYMAFDSVDLAYLKLDGTFQAVILHEMGHVLGLGTMWSVMGLIGSRDAGCPYNGVYANREWQAITGCTGSIPIETDGGMGTQCGHWDETCLQNEIMTGYLGDTQPIFSNITIAAMEDLGYDVDYSQAEAYTAANVNASCLCSRRLASPNDFHDSFSSALLLSGVTKSRKLSPEGYRAAREHGQRHLEKMSEIGKTLIPSEFVNFVGDKAVTVFYMEDGHIYRVHVSKESDAIDFR